jgi:hypothetical protein
MKLAKLLGQFKDISERCIRGVLTLG